MSQMIRETIENARKRHEDDNCEKRKTQMALSRASEALIKRNKDDFISYKQKCKDSINNQHQDGQNKLEKLKQSNYQKTLRNHKQLATECSEVRQEAESQITKLENLEMQLISKLKTTMSQKDQAVQELKTRSSQLMKCIEPRNAYTVKTKAVEE